MLVPVRNHPDGGVGPMVVSQATVAAFSEVYRANVTGVYRFCLSQLRNPSDAEDVTAEVFASAFSAYQRTRVEPDNVRAWLFRIARNAVVDHHRRDRRRRLLHLSLNDTGEHDISVDIERDVAVRDELRYVLSQMRRLRQRDRLLLGLRVAARQTYAEIGETLGLTEHAATVATRRAMERLRLLCEQGRSA